VHEGERVMFVLSWAPSWLKAAAPSWEPEAMLTECNAFWEGWASRCCTDGLYAPQIKRSLLTLKALTFAPTGGMVAAPTTSLPEWPGSTRNWDYRFCWLRDATFTLYALVSAGYKDEARAWRDWLLRAAAGSPEQVQVAYGVAGERRLSEVELPWLSGSCDSRPVRIGNAAVDQLQLDIFGELADMLYLSRRMGLEASESGRNLARVLLSHLEAVWREPDHGIWEVRGRRRHFVHSKVMCWVAFDRGVKAIDREWISGPRERWLAIRDEIHAEVCRDGFSASTGSFVQYYGASEPDASLLLMPIVGFLPADDPRIRGTLTAIEQRLLVDRLVRRYVPHERVDGLPEGEGAFLACSFWYVDALVLAGRTEEARAHYERLLSLANDVGLLAEEYDPQTRRMLGNFPQALSHVALVNSALNLSRVFGPAHMRRAH
jgi:GH15 family glucan-1,4-alpha-glucosidase